MSTTLNPDHYEALFIDIDGTAVNSEPIIREVIEDMAAKAGHTIYPEDWDTLAGLGDKGVWAKLCEWCPEFNQHYKSGEQFEHQRLANYVDRINEVEANKPVLNLTERFVAANKRVIAVTNSPPDIAIPHLEGAGYPLDKMGLITQEDAFERGLESKPHPALYNMAYFQTGLWRLDQGIATPFEKKDCLVAEDSATGVYAGLSAGMANIQLTDMCKPADPDRVISLKEEFGGTYFEMTFAKLQHALDTTAASQTLQNKSTASSFVPKCS